MASFELRMELPASPRVAWDFVVEHPDEVESITFVPRGEQGAGVLNDLTARVLGVPIRGVSRTVEWDPPSVCAFESVKPAWPVRTRIVESFEPSNEGTLHCIHYDVSPQGAIGRLVAPVLARLMKRNRAGYQRRLRSALHTNT